MSSKKYILWFCIFSLIIISVISVTNYIVDPFMKYRVKDGEYILNPRFVNPGLLKNYDYDLLVIGSSMVQLFDMDMLRKKMPSKPLKAASGDMNIEELELIFSLAKKEDVNTFIINLDLHKFFEVNENNRYAEYLYKDGLLNDLKYLLSYEANKFTPVDIAVSRDIRKEGITTPKLYNRTKIDRIGDFSTDLNFDHLNVIRDFRTRVRPDTTDIYNRMTSRFDEFLSAMNFEKYKDKEFIFFLPPYSVVYWYAAQKDGYYRQLTDFIRYVVNKTKGYENIRIVSLYDSEFIVEADTYADMVHFSPIRMEFVMDAIADKSNNLNPDNLEDHLNKLDNIIRDFRIEYQGWLDS